jgi:hypothetical protein
MQQSQRLSQMLFVTLREDPVEAELPSHKLLLRGCFIRRLSPGIYTYLPLLWRVLQKISEIVREEMNAIGAQECLLPQLQPAEIWRESGRWEVYTQAEGIMFALKDRQGREQALGPTHEEVITLLARDLIRSYRQLPQTLYQIQTKFRDEIRPRFGLMRGREFIMKDAYSFHANEESLRQTYQDMYRAYSRILRRCGLEFRVVDADAGAIGGPSAASQEFMVLASAGEDEILYTPDGSYAANVEKAVSIPPPAAESPYTAFQVLDTPGTETIEKLAAFLKISSTLIVKNVLYQALYDNGLRVAVLLSIRGDQEVNEVKLANHLSRLAERYQASKLLKLALADAEIQNSWQGDPIPVGYIAPDLPDSCLGRQKKPCPPDPALGRPDGSPAAELRNRRQPGGAARGGGQLGRAISPAGSGGCAQGTGGGSVFAQPRPDPGNGPWHRDRPYLSARPQVLAANAGHLYRRTGIRAAPLDGLLWHWGIPLGPGGGGTVPRCQRDHLARGHCPLSRSGGGAQHLRRRADERGGKTGARSRCCRHRDPLG